VGCHQLGGQLQVTCGEQKREIRGRGEDEIEAKNGAGSTCTKSRKGFRTRKSDERLASGDFRGKERSMVQRRCRISRQCRTAKVVSRSAVEVASQVVACVDVWREVSDTRLIQA